MFVILLTYKKPLEVVDHYIAAHIDFLERCYQKNYFIVSGRKVPRTGGVIISQLTDRAELDEIIKQDPFSLQDIADYEIVEFTPTKYQTAFSLFIS